MDYCEDCERFVEADIRTEYDEDLQDAAVFLVCPYCLNENIVTPQEDDFREAL